jgi:uncharacterized protein (TIRG00374 family)
MKRWWIPLLQISVTAILLAWFLHKPEFRQQAIEALASAHPGWLALGVALAGIENFLGVCRWRIFLRMLDIELSLWKSVQICLVALFCNTFMLGSAGGDLVRAAYLMRRGNCKVNSLLSVVMDRLSGLIALTFYTIALTIWNADWLLRSPIVTAMIKLVLAFQIASLLVVAVTLVIAARGWTDRLPRWAPFKELVSQMGAGYSKLASKWAATLEATGLSFFMLLAFFGVFACSAMAFSVPVTFLQMSALMPVSDVISALPISIGGLGVREQVFVVLLGQLAGVPEATAVSVSFFGYLMNNSWGLVGAAILPLFKGIVHDARVREGF